jgi:dCMP deaminase
MMTRLAADDYFMGIARLVAQRATCPRRQVGIVLVDEQKRILATGYNGPPRGLPHCIETPCAGRFDESGNSDRCEAIHAEINAVIQCHRLDLAHTLYATTMPCYACAKANANTPVTRVVYAESYADQRGVILLDRAGIRVEQFVPTI